MKSPLLAALFAFAFVLPARATVEIAEFMADNEDGLSDADGDNSDWIELHNGGAAAVNLDGWYLTDDAQSPHLWPLPAQELAAGGRLVVFASGKDRRTAGGELHTNFSLNQDGEYLALIRPDDSAATEFAPVFPPQRANVSYGTGVSVETDVLVHGGSAGKYRVPAAEEPGWQAAGFNDAAWSATTARAGYQTGGARPGQPIAWWTFDNTDADLSGNGRTAERRNGVSYSPQSPSQTEPGDSLSFTGAQQQYVSVPLDVSETAYTCSLWFRTSAASCGLFTVTDADLGAGGYDRLLYLSGGNIFARTWNNETISSTGRNFADSNWHHVVHVFGGTVGGQRIYVDGVQVAAGVKAQSDFNWQRTINIGFTNDAGANAYFTGEIDDVAVWSEALGAASIAQLYAGVSPLALSGYGTYITTNLETAMRTVNSSVRLRFPFTVTHSGDPYNRFSFQTRYDDGFVAWLDGVEIARRNAPAALTWNAAATADRLPEEGIVQETVDLTAFLPSLTSGAHVLAIQGLNDSAGSPDFLLNAELAAGVARVSSGVYFVTPTPGQANAAGASGFVADTVFTPRRGFYETAQTVAITCATPGASIAWTTNGTEPSPLNGTIVAAANAQSTPVATVNVSTTTNLRAMAWLPASTMQPTNVDTHSYLFIAAAQTQPAAPAGYATAWAGRAADYAVDQTVVNSAAPGFTFRDGMLTLPAMVMTLPPADMFTGPSGIYYDTNQRGVGAERKVAIEMIHPDGVTENWSTFAGTRLHGNSSRSHGFTPKHPLRLHFREEYGVPKLRRQVFPEAGSADRFDQLLLRACSTDSFPVVDGNIEDSEQRWNNDKATYVRDQWMRDALNTLGHPNAHGRYVHLFINNLYWGLYNLSERPTATFFASYFGGDKSEWDVLKDFAEVNDGNGTAWNEMLTIVNSTTMDNLTKCQRLLGNNPDGSRNPAYPIYIHLPSFMDYMIVHICSGAEDWPDHNYWVGRRRGPLSEGFRFVSWDQEIANDSLTRTSGRGSDNPFEAVDEVGPSIVYDKFRRVPLFQKMFRERIHELIFNNGPLSPSANRARWAVRQAQIDKAIVCESARWGDGQELPAKRRETTWMNNMNWMQTPVTGYWDAIFPIQVQRWRNVQLYPAVNQPVMSQQGGVVAPGFALSFTSDQPAVYYTLDGSDPMGANGEPSASAQFYNGGTSVTNVVPAGAAWKYLVTNVDQGTAWRTVAFDDSAWPSGAAPLGYGDGDEATVIGFGGNTAARYITTYFRRKFTITNKAGVQSVKLHLLRDDGAVVHINGTAYVVRSNMHPTNPITWATTASSNVGGADETSFFYQYDIPLALLVEGENVLAVEIHNVSATSDDLSFHARLEVTQSSTATPVVLNQSGTVTARARSSGGEWSGRNSAYFTVGAQPAFAANIVISELHYHPAEPLRDEELLVSADPDDFEFIELANISGTPVDLTGCAFTAGITFAFPVGCILPVGGRCVVVRNAAAFAARYGAGLPVAGEFENGSGLSNGGEPITLSADGGAVIKSFAWDDAAPWPAAADGNGPSLHLVAPQTNPDHALSGNWVAAADFNGTPGTGGAQFSYAAWRRSYARGNEGPETDADADGVNNAIEYALLMPPGTPATTGLPVAEPVTAGGETYLGCRFRRRAGPADLMLAVETGDSLNGWSGGAVLVSVEEHGDETRTEIWRAAQPLSALPRQQMRVRVVLTP